MAQLSRIDTLAHTNAWAKHALFDKALLAGGLLIAGIALPALPAAPLVFVVAVTAALFGAKVAP
jgi:hypothetical protein